MLWHRREHTTDPVRSQHDRTGPARPGRKNPKKHLCKILRHINQPFERASSSIEIYVIMITKICQNNNKTTIVTVNNNNKQINK